MNTAKQIVGVSILLGLLAGMGTAQAETLDWNGGDGAWETAANWETNGLPAGRIPIAGDGVNVQTYVGTARVSTVTARVPASGNLGAINIKGEGRAVIQTGGEVYSSANMWVGYTGGGTYELQDGKFTLTSGLDISGVSVGGQIGYFIQSGGTATVNSVRMNYKGSGSADIEISDGEFTVNGNLQMAYVSGGGVASYFTQTGGVATVTGQLRLGNSTAQSTPHTAVVNLDGGELTIEGATPLFFADPLDNFMKYGSGPTDSLNCRPDENWKGNGYWFANDIDPTAGEDWVAQASYANQRLYQIWTNTVTQTGEVTLGFDLNLNGDDDIAIQLIGWYYSGSGDGYQTFGNEFAFNQERVFVEAGYNADLLLGAAGVYTTDVVPTWYADVTSLYLQTTDGDGITIALDPNVDLSKYAFIGIKFLDANAGVQLDNITLTTADGGAAQIAAPGFTKADLGVLMPGGPHCVDFDGGALYVKASSGITDFASLTAIANSDFRSFGEPAAANTLQFTTENIGGTDYTKIIAIVPPPVGTLISIR
jgi:hypothetical protein